MKPKTLYLYGPPASGKTTLAKRLARECGRMYLDLDEEIVRRTGRTIPDIFSKDGEAEFRRIESETLREIDAPIIALGGGTLLDPRNREYAEGKGYVVVLEADPEEIARRIEAASGTRPLGNMLAERRAHYASFPHHFGPDDKILLPRPLRGRVVPPVSKSHLHRILIAQFLSGADVDPAPAGVKESEDIAATRRCIEALARARAAGSASAVLDCGESGSTLRFFSPVAAALGIKAQFVKRGRLASRPSIEYDSISPGRFELPGNVSSQFVTGLLFALPILDGDSEIVLTVPLQSRGYVDMTLRVLSCFGVSVEETESGFKVPGRQKYAAAGRIEAEADWSGAAFWFAANALGSELEIAGLDAGSAQPDRVVCDLIERIKRGETVDVSECPDNYPALSVVAHALKSPSRFTGTERLRIKESDRIEAMEDVFRDPCDVDPRNDHRIAMAAAVLSTVADGPVLIHGASCVNKSYPGFWDVFKMDLYAVTGWPLAKTGSPALHNAAHAKAGRAAEMVSFPARTIEEALRFAERCAVKGMAVTIPHKEAVMKHLDSVDAAAEKIGAVNTVVFSDGAKRGYNTDEPGFAKAILDFTGRPDLKGVNTALLGNGGAAKAVKCALERLGAEVEVVHRRPLLTRPDLIVNATPVDPVPGYVFSPDQLVYDLRYEPPVTPLMERASAAGCRTENGYSMLKAQAEGQLALFCPRA